MLTLRPGGTLDMGVGGEVATGARLRMPRRMIALLGLVLASRLITLAAQGGLVLHPSGFGTMSYSAWKAQQGLKDDTGNDFQALYFQKMTTTPTFAAGVAVIKGLEGMPASALTGLEWDHRTDGHCGAGAPRWNVNLTNGSQNFTVFFGCYAAQHTTLTATDPG